MTKIIIKSDEMVKIKDLEVGDWAVDPADDEVFLVIQQEFDSGHHYRMLYFSFTENHQNSANNSDYKVYKKKKAVVELE